MNRPNLYIAAQGGTIYRWDWTDLMPIIGADSTIMGMGWDGDELLMSSLYTMGRFSLQPKPEAQKVVSFHDLHPHFHEFQLIGGYVYNTATDRNEIFIIDKDTLEVLRRPLIDPPNPDKDVWSEPHPNVGRANYNHINNIFFYEGQAYVNLGWGTSTKFGSSGVAVMSPDLREEQRRFEYGWETHGFFFLNDTPVALCGSCQNIKEINHPEKAGLMVDGTLRWEHDPAKWYCKGMAANEDHIFIVGGEVAKREDREFQDGILFVLDRDFNLQETRVFDSTGGFTGVLPKGQDLTRNNCQLAPF